MIPCAFYENCKKVSSCVSVTMHLAWQTTIYAIIRIIFPRTLTEEEKRKRRGEESEERTVHSRRKTIEVSEGEWVVLSRESQIVCREIVARWRIPDCERALLANGQKNRCEVADVFGSVEGLSEHFLTVRHSYLTPSLPRLYFLYPFSSSRTLTRDEEEINASSRNLCRETRDNENVIYRKCFWHGWTTGAQVLKYWIWKRINKCRNDFGKHQVVKDDFGCRRTYFKYLHIYLSYISWEFD